MFLIRNSINSIYEGILNRNFSIIQFNTETKSISKINENVIPITVKNVKFSIKTFPHTLIRSNYVIINK